MMLFTHGMWQGKQMVPHLERLQVRNWLMVVAVKVEGMWRTDMTRNMREIWIQEAILPIFLDIIAIIFFIIIMEWKIVFHVNVHMIIRLGKVYM